MTRTDLQQLAEAYSTVQNKEIINEGIMDRMGARFAGVKNRIKDLGKFARDEATPGGSYASGKTDYLKKSYEDKFNGLLADFEEDLVKAGVDQSHLIQISDKIKLNVKDAFANIKSGTVVVPPQDALTGQLALSSGLKKVNIARALASAKLVILDRKPTTVPDQALLAAELLKVLKLKNYPDARLVKALSDTTLFLNRA